MLSHLSLCALLVAVLAHARPSQGSETSGGSAENSGEIKDGEDKSKAGGAQRQFWMPTYRGKNPLARKQIAITTSEIEKYYTSEEMPESEPVRNRSRRAKEQTGDEESMPLLWSGDQPPTNKSQQLDFSMDSDKISLDSEISSSKTSNSEEISVKVRRNKRPTRTPNLKQPQQKKRPKNSKTDAPSKLSSEDSKLKTRITTKNTIKLSKKKEYVEKELTSQFFDELNNAASNESKLTTDYYKRLVKDATDNTKQKLGYRKIFKTTVKPPKPTPEFVFVNLDSKSKDKSNQEEEIIFSTHHDQHGADLQEKLPKVISKKKKSEIRRVNKLAREFTGKLRHKKLGTNESATVHSEDSFTSACDYSAWSDVLLRNRTFRTFKQRKPKLPMRKGSFGRSDEGFEKWPGKDLKDKAHKLRERKGKREKKKSKDKKTKIKKNNDYADGEDDDYDYQDENKSEKKIRMRTKGEKNHAVREVKDYLKKMDNKYGGRPGEGKRKDKRYERDRGQDRYRGRETERNFGYDRKPWDEDGNKGRGYRGRQDGEREERNDRGRGGRWDERGDRRREDRGMDRRDRRGRGRGNDRGGRWDRRRDDERGDRGGERYRGRWDRRRDDERGDRGGERNRGRWDRGRDDRRNVRGSDRGRRGGRGRGRGGGRGRGRGRG